jgi:hypothetical protein
MSLLAEVAEWFEHLMGRALECYVCTGRQVTRASEERLLSYVCSVLHQFFIPVPHLTTCIPKRPVDGHEVSILAVLEGLFEFRPCQLFAGYSYHIALFVQRLVQLVVPFDRVTKVEDGWFRHCEEEDRLCCVGIGMGFSLRWDVIIYAAILFSSKAVADSVQPGIVWLA